MRNSGRSWNWLVWRGKQKRKAPQTESFCSIWQNTEVVQGLTKEEILTLKQHPGKNMMIFGSGTLVEQLTKLGLIDEYQLMMNPIVLGKSKPLFNNITGKMNLTLVLTKAFKSGIVLLKYQPVKS